MTDSSSGSSGSSGGSSGGTGEQNRGEGDRIVNSLRKSGYYGGGGSRGGGSNESQEGEEQSGHYDSEKQAFVGDDGKVYPTSNPNFVPKGYKSSNPTNVRQGPANGESTIPITKSTSGQQLVMVSPGLYQSQGGQLIPTRVKETQEDRAVQKFLEKNPPLKPGIYADNLAVYQGKKTRDYTTKDIFQNPTLVDTYTPQTRRPFAALQKVREEHLKNQNTFQPENESTSSREANGLFTGTDRSNSDIAQGLQSAQSKVQAKRPVTIGPFETGINYGDNGNPTSAELFQKSKDTTGVTRTVGYGAASVGVGFLEGSYQLVFHPVETVKGIGNSIIHPVRTVKDLWTALKENPTGTSGQLIATAVATHGVIKATPEPIRAAVPRPVVETVEIPQQGGNIATVTTVGIKSGSRALPVVSKVTTVEGASYGLGTPSIGQIIRNIPEGTDVKIGGPVATKVISKNLAENPDATPRAQEVIPVAQRVIRKTQLTRAKVPENIILETERLTPQGVKTVLNVAKQEEATVFGSFSRRQTSAEFNTPRDIDVRLRNANEETVARVTQQTIQDLEKVGLKARERADTPGAIEVLQKNGVYEKAVEFKGKNLAPGEESVPEYVLGFRKEGAPTTIAGQRFSTLNEELRGTGQGVFRLRVDKGKVDLSPPLKRVKDIQSFITSAEVLQKSQRIKRPGLAQDIERIKELYQPKASAEPDVHVIADYSRGRSPTSPAIPFPEEISPLSSPSQANSPSSPSTSPKAKPLSPSPSPLPSESPKISPSPSPAPRSPISPSPSPSPRGRASPSPSSSSPSPIASPSPPISPVPTTSTSASPSPTKAGSPSPTASPFILPRGQQKEEPEFDVQVKRFGRFYRFNTQGLKLEQAVKFGQDVARSTLAASFTVVDEGTNTPISGQNKARAFEVLDKQKFGTSKKTSNIFVQKARSRLDTPGERSEIQQARKASVFSTKKVRRGIAWA